MNRGASHGMGRAERYRAIDRLLGMAASMIGASDDPPEPPVAGAAAGAEPRGLVVGLADALEATGFGAGETFAEAARSEEGLALSALRALAEERSADALALLSVLLDDPVAATGLATQLEELGARLAGSLGQERLAVRFLERRAAYRQRYGPAHAVDLVTGLLADPEWLADVEAMLGVEVGAGPPVRLAEASGPTAEQGRWPGPRAQHQRSGFVPFAREPRTPGAPGGGPPGHHPDAHGEDEAMAYLVTLRHLDEARTASFSAHRIGWHELDSGLAGVSDLVLSFEQGAEGLLRQVDPEALSLRLFFGDGPGYDEFTTSSGSLFDVEANPTELRIYLKLRRPPAWSATGLPAAELWRQLSSCVLITEPG